MDLINNLLPLVLLMFVVGFTISIIPKNGVLKVLGGILMAPLVFSLMALWFFSSKS